MTDWDSIRSNYVKESGFKPEVVPGDVSRLDELIRITGGGLLEWDLVGGKFSGFYDEEEVLLYAETRESDYAFERTYFVEFHEPETDEMVYMIKESELKFYDSSVKGTPRKESTEKIKGLMRLAMGQVRKKMWDFESILK